jgi:hypothetical protein
MLKRSWKLVVLYETLEPQVFYFNHDKYPFEVVVELAEHVMITHGAINYSITEVWVSV